MNKKKRPHSLYAFMIISIGVSVISYIATLYMNGWSLILTSIILLFSVIMFITAFLYSIIRHYFIRPLGSLISDVGIVGHNTEIDTKKYAQYYELHTLSLAINDMRKGLEQSYQEGEESKISLNVLKNILNGLDAYLYVSDPITDEILFINDNMKNHFNLEDDAVGRTCWKLLQSGFEDRCDFCPCFKLENHPDDPVVWEEHNTVTNRYYRNTDRYIDWIGGRKAHLQHSVDITDLITAKELAEQSSRSKSEFLSRMSHEMRTPMNAIIGMTNIAKDSDDPDKKEYCLDNIDNASRHLLGVINDILDMSKIEANKFNLSYTEFNFERMLHSVLDVLNFRIEEKHQSFSLYIDPAIPQVIVSDEQHLAQVITNLLTNAVKFTPDKGNIQLNACRLGEENGVFSLQIEIIDSGIGIANEQQSKLFHSFEQADGSIARKFGGTGLGLAISRYIVELMGGKIWVESELGKGSRFVFTLEVEKGKGNSMAYNPGIETEEEPESEEKDFPQSLENKTILLAEDVEINREIIITVLEDTKLKIDCAENGQQAIEMFAADPDKYDLIFMDVQMPEVDGLEATRRIRSMAPPKGAQVPIVAMTANVFHEDIKKCLEVGMDDHIGKPIDFDELLIIIKKYLYI